MVILRPVAVAAAGSRPAAAKPERQADHAHARPGLARRRHGGGRTLRYRSWAAPRVGPRAAGDRAGPMAGVGFIGAGVILRDTSTNWVPA
jgi:hypothetical protein